jgi:uncharacterized protein YdeI (YjbR/CyaY-like superfamily)
MASATKAQVMVESRSELRQWLTANAAKSGGVWLVTFKKAVGSKHLSYDEIVEELICFGWIDSLPRALDEKRSQLYIAPRKPGSAWSTANKARAEKMIAAKRIKEAGLMQIEIAKDNGKWDFLTDVQKSVVPHDLAKALTSYKGAREKFDAFPPSSKRIILEWIKMAKKPDTRAKRIEETASLAAKGIRAHHHRQ